MGGACRGRQLQAGPSEPPSHKYLVHFVQTLVAYFQALDDLHFNLGEFNVLDLEWEGEREEPVSLWPGIGTGCPVNPEGI